MEVESEREMLGKGGYPGFSAPPRTTVRTHRKTTAPFLHRAVLPRVERHAEIGEDEDRPEHHAGDATALLDRQFALATVVVLPAAHVRDL